MFAVIYQGYVKPDREEEYEMLWRLIASYFIEKRGALGSTLHRASDGRWLAYSRWPDKATRDASWPGENSSSEELPNEIRSAIAALKDCVQQNNSIPEICLDVVHDFMS